MSRTYRAHDPHIPDDPEAELYWAECQRGEHAYEHYEWAFRDPHDPDEPEDDHEPF